MRNPAALPGRDEASHERNGKPDRGLRGGSVADDINGAGSESGGALAGDAAVPERWLAVLECLSRSCRELYVGVRMECAGFVGDFIMSKTNVNYIYCAAFVLVNVLVISPH